MSRAFVFPGQGAQTIGMGRALAEAYLTAYGIEKAAMGALDFSDLIEKTAALVQHAPMAAWVLFKLDGGIDHILVDEAQDTAPEQWEIIDSLVGDITAFFSRNLFKIKMTRKDGTLTYEGDRWPGEVHLHVGAFDEPAALAPTGHAFDPQGILVDFVRAAVDADQQLGPEVRQVAADIGMPDVLADRQADQHALEPDRFGQGAGLEQADLVEGASCDLQGCGRNKVSDRIA